MDEKAHHSQQKPADSHAGHDNSGQADRSLNQHEKHGGKHSGSDHHRMMIADFRKRFWFSLVLTVPVLLLSPMIQVLLGFSIEFPGDLYLLFGFASAVYFYGGWPFLNGLAKELKKKEPGMMTLIGMAITVAYGYSVAVLLGFQGDFLFWEIVTLIDIMLLGHWIEMKSVLGASQALDKLAQLMPNEAHLIRENGHTEEVNISELHKGDTVLIKPGEKIPADGDVTKGKSYIDESMLTGESKPVERQAGDKVIGGSINGDGSLEVKISGAGSDSYLSKVVRLVEEAQLVKSKTQRLADRAALVLTIIALTAGALTLASWLLTGETPGFAIERAVAVMVIACPHALGLAIPLVVSVSTSLSAKNGLLIRNRTAFENARKITTVVFDKTGTLTEGSFGVIAVQLESDTYDESEVLRLAAAVEQQSEHPIAAGILTRAKGTGIDVPQVTHFISFKGQGIAGKVNGEDVKVVSPGYLRENNITFTEDTESSQATTTVYVLVNDALTGAIHLADKIRPSSFEAIKALQEMGIKCRMLTGDNLATAKSVSTELNLDGYEAEVLPDQKQAKIKELQEKGEFVAMTGDGVNDAPALAQADVGIAIGSGTDVAAETADIILVDSDPQDVVTLIRFGKATHGKMVQNLFWATGYNLFALPLAAGVFYHAGLVISPAIGAVFMTISTVIVAVNAKLLKLGK